MMKKTVTTVLFIGTALLTHGQNLSNVQLPELRKPDTRREILIPDILGYKTLKCDFHIHTMFSDGTVWPTVRVDEAWREGLDVISITEHIENNPSKKYVSGDKNASYEIAKPAADEKGIILLRAGEITRAMPPGHLNAIFLDDVNALDTQEPWDAIQAAKNQNAFILWNHPGWKAQQPDTCLWHDYHEKLYKEGMMHGIEVFNECEWYPIALDWCLSKNLAPVANSDIHGVAGYYYDYDHYFRPMTLVFASSDSPEAIKDALMKAQTVAFFADKLAGKETYLDALFKASVTIKATGIKNRKGEERFLLINNSDIPFYLSGDLGITLYPRKTIAVSRMKGQASVTVTNLFTGGTKNLSTLLVF
jgi:hypothetical protein